MMEPIPDTKQINQFAIETNRDHRTPKLYPQGCRGLLSHTAALLVTLLVMALAVPSPVRADEPLFGFAYTTDLLPKGGQEVEQWMTWRHQKVSGSFNQIDQRTEIEYGLTDRLQGALYANYDWTSAYHNGPFGATTPPEPFSYDQPGPDDRYRRTRFVGISAEAIYRLLSPYTNGVGLAVYVEPILGAGFGELESKLILQKNFRDDRLVFALNFTYAPELRHLSDPSDPSAKSWQEETDVNANFGASYRFRRNWSAGFEFLNEREFNSYNFTHESNSGYFLGPAIHYAGKRFFVTATFLEQMPWATAHSDTVPGALVGGRVFDNDFEKYRVRIKLGWYWGGKKR